MVGAGPARPERRGARPDGRADRQDVSLAPGLEGGDDVPRDGGPDGRRSRRSASPSPATAARPASATAGRWTSPSPRRSRSTSSSPRPSCRATATSRAASIPSRGRATSPRRRWWSPSRSRAGSTSTSRRSRSGSTTTASRSSWPTSGRRRTRSARSSRDSIDPELFRETYASVFEGDDRWRALPIPDGRPLRLGPRLDLHRAAAVLRGPRPPSRRRRRTSSARACSRSSATRSRRTTSRRPARSRRGARRRSGSRSTASAPLEFNSYGARRGHHEVMMRGTFGNIRLRNALAASARGRTPSTSRRRARCFIYDAAMRYRAEGVPLVILAGQEYGSGSSRDWAAKGPCCWASAPSSPRRFERIHRSNLVGMGVLPLQFLPGENAASLGLTGRETYHDPRPRGRASSRASVDGLARDRRRRPRATLRGHRRLDGPIEVDYYRNGGILPAVLRRLARESAARTDGLRPGPKPARPGPRPRAAAHRPAVSASHVMRVPDGPAATARPSASSSAWPKPAGISSTWCVTSTIADSRRRPRATSAGHAALARRRGPGPAAGSSSSSRSGGVISVRRWAPLALT